VRYGKPADVQIFAGHTRFATTSKAYGVSSGPV